MSRTLTCRLALVALTLLVPRALRGQEQPVIYVDGARVQPAQEADFARFLFPPELVMQHQAALGLTPQQRTTITDAIKRLQGDVLDVQWDMQQASQRLTELLRGPQVDADAALAQVDQIFELEHTVKRVHLATLIRIKNTLTPEQQRLLLERRDAPGPKGPGA